MKKRIALFVVLTLFSFVTVASLTAQSEADKSIREAERCTDCWCGVHETWHGERTDSRGFDTLEMVDLEPAEPGRTYEIDILFWYTPEFADDFGGGFSMEDEIEASVRLLNEAFANSRVNAKVRTVGIERHESMPSGQSAAHDWIMSNEHAKRRRDELGADLVYALVDDPDGFAGVACQPGSFVGTGEDCFWGSVNNFTASRRGIDNELVWRTILRHEVGHNLGIQHSPTFGGDPEGGFHPGAVGYSNGTPGTADFYGTVMGGNELPRFSTSSARFDYQGRTNLVVGEPGVHEASTALLLSIGPVSAYRPASRFLGDVSAKPVGDAAVVVSWRGRWSDPAKGTLGVEARSLKMAWRLLTTVSAADGSVRIEGLEEGTPYTFRLRADSSNGGVERSVEVSATTGFSRRPCRKGPGYLCLWNGRFELRAFWTDPDSDRFGTGVAVPVAVSEESGLFWFFDQTNIELVVKVLDGRSLNGNWWVYFGALSDVEYWVAVRDTTSGASRTYHNAPKTICGQSDTAAFQAASSSAVDASLPGSWGVADPSAAGVDLLPLPVAGSQRGEVTAAAGTCEGSPGRLCLLDRRFSVEVRFVDPNAADAGMREAKVLPSLSTPATGFFWFFNPENVELAVKALDGRAINGRFWVLYGGLSDVEYEITVTDTVTGASKTWRNEKGSLCGQVETEAF